MKKRGKRNSIKNKRDKRGSHIGIMMSFVIFVIFLGFLYYIIAPATKAPKNQQDLLGYLEVKLIENLSIDVEVISVKINDSYVFDPSSPTLFLMNSANFINSNRTVVKDDSNNNMTFLVQPGQGIMILKGTPISRFYNIYHSESFDDNGIFPGIPIELIPEENYTVGLIKTYSYIYEKDIFSLKDFYESNYETLKTQLNVPQGNDFGFGFTFNDTTEISTQEPDVQTNIFVNEIPVEYINQNADILEGILKIRVW